MTFEKAYDYLRANQGYLKWGDDRLADKLDASPNLVRNAKNQVKEDLRQDRPPRSSKSEKSPAHTHKNESDNTSTNDREGVPESARSDYLKHLDDLGLTEDDVKSVKYWQTMTGAPRYSIVQKMETAADMSAQDLRDVIDDHLGGYTPPTMALNQIQPTGKNLGVLNLYDAHLDRISLASETHEGFDGTIQGNVDSFENAFMQFLEVVHQQGVQHLHFPLGHDLWEVNDHYLLTKNGTPQRVSVPWQTGFSMGLDMIRRCIDAASQIVDTMEVILIPGNHDEDQNFYLGEVLRHVYREHPTVEVEYARKKRKYRLWGKTLLGYSHGEKTSTKSKIEKLPLNMAFEAQDVWGDALFRILYLGHIHHKEEYSILTTFDGIGCEVKFLRSVARESKYEADSGFTGVPKTARLDVFSEEGTTRWNQELTWW